MATKCSTSSRTCRLSAARWPSSRSARGAIQSTGENKPALSQTASENETPGCVAGRFAYLEPRLARADDGDEVVTLRAGAAAARRDRAGDIITVDLAVGHRGFVLVRLAIGVGGGRAALGAAFKAAIDAVTAGVRA